MVEAGVTMLSIMFMCILIIFSTTIQLSIGAAELLHACNTGKNYTQGSPIQENLQHVLGALPNETASSTKGYHASVYGESPNTVYAMGMCIGDQKMTQCRSCLQDAATSLQTLCGLTPGGRVMDEKCFVRWENASFSTSLDLTRAILVNVNDAFNTTANSLSVHGLFANLIGEALRSKNMKRYATGKAAVDSTHNIFGQVQCWGDISDDDCKRCFASGIDQIGTKEGSRVFTGNCYARYENTIFFHSDIADSPTPAPALPHSHSPPIMDSPTPMNRQNSLSPPHSISHKINLGMNFHLLVMALSLFLV